MAKKKQPDAPKRMDPHVQGLRAEVMEQPICQTLEQNYMPYAMSVIVSRAIPEIDGFKASLTESCCIRCTKWGFLTEPGQKSRILSARRLRLNPARRSGNL